MMKQLISLLLSHALVMFLCTSTFGASFQEEKEARETANVKAQIAKIGTRTRQVEIRLHDNTKLKGYVQEIAEDDFVFSDTKTSAVTRITYAQVQKVKEIKDLHLSDRKPSVIAGMVVTALFVWANWTDRP